MDRYSWDQLAFMGECVGLHHVAMLEAFLAPISAAVGVDYKPGSVRRGTRPSTSVDRSSAASVERAKARDAKIMAIGGQIPGVKIEM